MVKDHSDRLLFSIFNIYHIRRGDIAYLGWNEKILNRSNKRNRSVVPQHKSGRSTYDLCINSNIVLHVYIFNIHLILLMMNRF